VKGGQKSVNISPGQYCTLSNSMAKWSKPGADGKKKNNFLQGCPKYTGRAVVRKLFSLQPFSATLTEIFPCFFLSCKANTRVKLAKTGHGQHSSKLVVICDVLCTVCV
jgi:hypothetical protein